MRQYISALTHVRFAGLCCLSLCSFFSTASILQAQNTGVGWWKFDETTGQTIGDSSGSANNGFLGNSTVADIDDPSWTSPGRLGPSALGFTPQNFAQVPDNASLEPANVSVQAWVQSSVAPANFAYMVGKGASDCQSSSYALYTGADGGAVFYILTASGFILSPSAPPAALWDGGWHHLMGTYDGSMVRLFVDGVEVGSGTPSGGAAIVYNLPDSNDLMIGSYDPAGCALAFNGKIDEVRIWKQALNPAVISTLATKSCNFVTTAVKPNTIARGGFVMVTGGLQNCLASSQHVVIQFDAATPCTKSLMASIPFTIPAHFSQSLTLPLFIPKNSCEGSYSISATTLIDGFPVTMSSAALNVTP